MHQRTILFQDLQESNQAGLSYVIVIKVQALQPGVAYKHIRHLDAALVPQLIRGQVEAPQASAIPNGPRQDDKLVVPKLHIGECQLREMRIRYQIVVNHLEIHLVSQLNVAQTELLQACEGIKHPDQRFDGLQHPEAHA